MKDRQTRGARSVPDRAPLVWTSFEQGTRASRSPPPAPWTAAPDCPKWTPWYTVEETRPARSLTLPMQKRPVVVTGRFFIPEQGQACHLPPCSPGDWPSFFRLWRYATCQGPEQKFWEGRGEHEGRGRTLFQKGLSPLGEIVRKRRKLWLNQCRDLRERTAAANCLRQMWDRQ